MSKSEHDHTRWGVAAWKRHKITSRFRNIFLNNARRELQLGYYCSGDFTRLSEQAIKYFPLVQKMLCKLERTISSWVRLRRCEPLKTRFPVLDRAMFKLPCWAAVRSHETLPFKRKDFMLWRYTSAQRQQYAVLNIALWRCLKQGALDGVLPPRPRVLENALLRASCQEPAKPLHNKQRNLVVMFGFPSLA